ncbi:hypothetical protein SSPS47_10845 [Streptomyces sp. S4.7]|uniref:hypothetical protein n=1 Tax=Streptomyces sp. S4.7 TaxID=2705439 RepID=UPI0013978EA5|nr:hypothetical protein [Streptomyces sp. S4.7]QHY95616.1 hypothetical protein SSPS47_10845 [Streptomyces sp. S4.7]
MHPLASPPLKQPSVEALTAMAAGSPPGWATPLVALCVGIATLALTVLGVLKTREYRRRDRQREDLSTSAAALEQISLLRCRHAKRLMTTDDVDSLREQRDRIEVAAEQWDKLRRHLNETVRLIDVYIGTALPTTADLGRERPYGTVESDLPEPWRVETLLTLAKAQGAAAVELKEAVRLAQSEVTRRRNR